MAVNPLVTVFSRIYGNVPKAVLQMAFATEGGGPEISLDERIKRTIIEGRILPEINGVCGITRLVPLKPEYIENSIDAQSQILGPSITGVLYRIPASARENREIVEAQEVTYTYWSNPISTADAGNNLTSMSEALLDSHTLKIDGYAPTAILRDGNIIQIIPNIITTTAWVKCILGYDSEFTNMPGGSVHALANYVMAVLKGHIYNELVIEMDQGAMIGGAQIGRFREIVDRYEQEGSTEQQNELLDKFRGSMVLSPESFRTLANLAM